MSLLRCGRSARQRLSQKPSIIDNDRELVYSGSLFFCSLFSKNASTSHITQTLVYRANTTYDAIYSMITESNNIS